MLMEVTCPKLLDRMTGQSPKSSHAEEGPEDKKVDLSEDNPSGGRNLRWSSVGGDITRTLNRKRSLQWSFNEEEKRRSMELDSFNDNDKENGTQEKKVADHSKDISNLYARINELELLGDHGDDISDIYSKLHKLELSLSENNLHGTLSNGSGNNEALYQAQNDLYAKLVAMERKMEDFRLALQVHKSSAELITDSVRCLHERTSEMEDELSQNSRPYESHIL